MATNSATSGSKPEPTMFDTQLELLSKEWDLGLKPLKLHSPSMLTGEESIVRKLSFCSYKLLYNDVVKEFKSKATELYKRWVKSSVSVRGLVPEKTRDRPNPISSTEREILLQLLRDILDRRIKACPKTPQKARTDYTAPLRAVPFPALSSNMKTQASNFKRPNEDPFASFTPSKKMRALLVTEKTMNPPAKKSVRSMPKPQRSLKQTSFESYLSTSTSTLPASGSHLSKESTQVTTPDQNEISKHLSSVTPSDGITNKCSQQQYWSSSLEASFDELDKQLLRSFDSATSTSLSRRELSSDEKLLRDQLQTIFTEMPTCLHSAPFCVSYEITRVFAHAGVSMSEFEAPTPYIDDYDKFWSFLRTLPALKGKPFPEQSSREAWACAIDPAARYSRNFDSVVFSVSLAFNSDASNGLFKLKLAPLRFALSHRSGRQFGHDRFLELRIPVLEAAPCYKNDIIPDLLLKTGPHLIYEWLVNSSHTFLGRQWMSFFVKPLERSKNVKPGANKSNGFQLSLFAVSGYSPRGYTKGHPDMTIGELLSRIRPTELNGEQSFLKLFSRTSLALSRNRPTIIVPQSQIRFHTQDILSGVEVMNDGAARISRSLGENISRMLGLSYNPTAYQGRFGGAKGLWVVDHVDDSNEDWIEVYPSQQKWKRSSENDEEIHRTFEVLAHSSKLRTHSLNEQLLQLLMNGATDKSKMKRSISVAMEHSLDLKLAEMDLALDNPQVLREWTRNSNPNLKERLNAGGISYKIAIPTVIEERLNIMLDAGFNQKSLLLIKEWVTKLFTRKCDDLKDKLSIPIARSAYPLMVPDFWGILEPGEVYIGFSSFTDIDGVTDLTDSIRDGDHVLVARNPAHLPSDIQKVKAVKRDKFLPMKDVIIFSTKGNPSLASMLSGGDYDGDRAWLCWDPTIVDNFDSVPVPAFPNLFEQGLLKRDTTTYNELAPTVKDREKAFLLKAIAFNMKSNLLPFCTSYKESMLFTTKSVSSNEMLYINTLLSNLVDRPKQGIIFDYEDWTAFADACITTRQHWVRAKIDQLGHNPNNDIIDHLRLAAKEKVDIALAKLHKKFPDSVELPNPQWDEDLARRFSRARDRAATNPEWKSLMDELVSDLKVVSNMWTEGFRRDSPTKGSVLEDESKPDFQTIANEVFAVYQRIRPHVDTPFTQALLPDDPYENPDISKWELLKASTLFASYPRSRVSNCVWWVAFPQLCYIKALSQPGQRLLLLTAKMWGGLKSDKTISHQMQGVDSIEDQEANGDSFADCEEVDG